MVLNNKEEFVTAEGALAPSAVAVPENLPVADLPAFLNGGEAESKVEDTEADTLLKDIEDYAHWHRVLLSSDAMRHLIKVSEGQGEVMSLLEQVVNKAKADYPSEDGWLVLNVARMVELCDTLTDRDPVREMVVDNTIALNHATGSLAEAILVGDVSLALKLIDNRPMVALSEATADIDAVYRHKRGLLNGRTKVSSLLQQEAGKLSVEQIEGVIHALTSAIDGTYTDEASAVKTAIMKAVAAVSR